MSLILIGTAAVWLGSPKGEEGWPPVPRTPLDGLAWEDIPAHLRPEEAPPGLVAVLAPAGVDRAVSVAVSPAGDRIAAGYVTGRVRLWAVGGRRLLRDWQAADGPVGALAFAAGGRALASGGMDGTVRTWAAEGTARPQTASMARPSTIRGTLGGTGGAVLALAWSPDGETLAVAREGVVDLVSAGESGGSPRGRLAAPGAPIHALAFSPDGGRLAAGGAGERAWLWELGPGGFRQAGRPGGVEEFRVRGLGFSPDGRRLASVDSDGAGLVWRAGEAPAGRWRSAATPCHAAAFAQDGRHLVVAHGPGTVWVLRRPGGWWR
jgi:WD40 repeat protein